VPGIDRVVVCFEYGGPLRAVLTALKYRNNRSALPWLGRCLAEAWGEAGLDGVLTWAPTGAARARRRGFDQAELLARRLAAELRSDHVATAGPVPLLRRGPGPAQTGRGGRQRHEAVHFECRRRRWRPDPPPIPERVVLIDDVITTGATLAAAAATLAAGGCRRVDALVVAWTPPPRRVVQRPGPA